MGSEDEPVRENSGTLDPASLIAGAIGTHEENTTNTNPNEAVATTGERLGPRLQAMLQAARYQGIELDVNEFSGHTASATAAPRFRFGRKMAACGRAPCAYAGGTCFGSRYRPGRAPVQGWQRRPAHGRQCRAGRLPEGSFRAGDTRAGRGR